MGKQQDIVFDDRTINQRKIIIQFKKPFDESLDQI